MKQKYLIVVPSIIFVVNLIILINLESSELISKNLTLTKNELLLILVTCQVLGTITFFNPSFTKTSKLALLVNNQKWVALFSLIIMITVNTLILFGLI